jgi:hypothetical protein
VWGLLNFVLGVQTKVGSPIEYYAGARRLEIVQIAYLSIYRAIKDIKISYFEITSLDYISGKV